MNQTPFGSLAYTAKKKQTRRERFLAETEQVVPWQALLALIAEHYPKSGKVDRPPISPEVMLRTRFLQQWYTLIDPAADPIPDETTKLKFRRFLEKHALAPRILESVDTHLALRGMQVRVGTLVNATIIHAPSSTENSTGTRDPEMHLTCPAAFGPRQKS